MIQVTINGQLKEIPDGLNIQSLISWLDFPEDRVAVEQNQKVVQRVHWKEAQVKALDHLEIVRFVGGGRSTALTFFNRF